MELTRTRFWPPSKGSATRPRFSTWRRTVQTRSRDWRAPPPRRCDALLRAKRRGAVLIIDFGGPFCHLCRKFEETALKDERVVKMLAKFEFVKIDTGADPDAAKDLDVHGVPDIWALDGDGKALARNNGYMAPEAFVEFLSKLLE